MNWLTSWVRSYRLRAFLARFLVTVVRQMVKQLRPSICVRSETRWNIIFLVFAALLASILPLQAFAQDTKTVRGAGMQMMGAALFVPGIAAYCDKNVGSNKPLLEAASNWNGRNKRLMEQSTNALRLSGDLSREEKDILARIGYKLVKEAIEGERDPIVFCANLTNVVKSGALDLHRRDDLAEARAIIRTVPSDLRAVEAADIPQQLQVECETGISRACRLLGRIYLKGMEGLTHDEAHAAFQFGKACDGGDALGCFEYGLALIDKNVQEDDFRAAALFRKACDAEIAISCTALGSMYDEGRGVPQDQTKAVTLYQKACEGGAPTGCNSLGSMYGEGRVVPRDLTKSVDLFRKACEGGYAMGCSNLGLGYAQGKGVK